MNIYNDYSQNPNSDYIIYTKSGCDFCRKLKNLLTIEKKTFTEINCDQQLSHNREQFLSSMKKTTGREWKTFPMVFVNTVFIGGYTETAKYIEREHAFSMFY